MRRALVVCLLCALIASCSQATTEDLQGRLDGEDGGSSAASDIGALPVDAGAPDLGSSPADLGSADGGAGPSDAGPSDCDPGGGQYAGRWELGFGFVQDNEGQTTMLSVQLGIGRRQHLEALEIFPDGRFVGRWAADPMVEVRGCTGVGPTGQAILQFTDCGPACDALFEGGPAFMTWAPTGALRLEVSWVGTAYLDQISSGGCGPYVRPMDDICLPLRDQTLTIYYEWSG